MAEKIIEMVFIMLCGIVAKCLKFPEKGIINITKGVCQAVITKESCAEYAEMARRLLCGRRNQRRGKSTEED